MPPHSQNLSPPPFSGDTVVTPTGRSRLAGSAGIGLRVAATLGLIAFVLRGIDWRSLRTLLESLDWRWFTAGIVTAVGIQVVAGIRWSALARPIGFQHSTAAFVWRFFEGVFFNLCLPSSIGGDVVKAYRLSETTRGRLLAGCTILADRLAGVSALGVLAGAALLTIKFALAPAATLAVGLALLVAVIVCFRLAVGSLDRLLDLLPLQQRLRQFVGQLLPYQQRPHLMTQAIGWSLIVQIGASVSVALLAQGIGVSLDLGIWFSVVPLISLAMVLPVSINGVGVREGGMALLLAPWGVGKEQAVAIGLLWFFATIVTGLIGGGLFLLDRRNPTDGSVSRAAMPSTAGR
jgi:uncharacterized membrane protein YbhN (UPF0104 family)